MIEIEGVVLIVGKSPAVIIEPGDYEPTSIAPYITKNQFFIWEHFSWWKRWLLKLCGLMQPFGNIEISPKSLVLDFNSKES